jgi:hypothetical protein
LRAQKLWQNIYGIGRQFVPPYIFTAKMYPRLPARKIDGFDSPVGKFHANEKIGQWKIRQSTKAGVRWQRWQWRVVGGGGQWHGGSRSSGVGADSGSQ